jgi:hypothetical protein
VALDLVLQLWGGTGYLAAKILLSYAEGLARDRKWRIAGWTAYLAGLPAWVVRLSVHKDWIAAAIEAGGAPSLVLGLVLAVKRIDHAPKALDRCVSAFIYIMIVFGISYSLYLFKGITALSQILEFGVTIGFLIGTYLLARKKSTGWLFYALMLISMGVLMLIQGKIILVFQQAISLVVAVFGFIRSMTRLRIQREK